MQAPRRRLGGYGRAGQRPGRRGRPHGKAGLASRLLCSSACRRPESANAGCHGSAAVCRAVLRRWRAGCHGCAVCSRARALEAHGCRHRSRGTQLAGGVVVNRWPMRIGGVIPRLLLRVCHHLQLVVRRPFMMPSRLQPGFSIRGFSHLGLAEACDREAPLKRAWGRWRGPRPPPEGGGKPQPASDPHGCRQRSRGTQLVGHVATNHFSTALRRLCRRTAWRGRSRHLCSTTRASAPGDGSERETSPEGATESSATVATSDHATSMATPAVSPCHSRGA